MSDSKDRIYANSRGAASPFRFDERVASVFSDMISRSVPSYRPILEMLPTITRAFKKSGHNYYDLGCSLGAGLHAMAEGLKDVDMTAGQLTKLIGIDNSQAMLKRARDHRCPYQNLNLEYIEQDILESEIHLAAMVLMNFTLQFIAIEERKALIERIYQGLVPGGALLLSEKISFSDPQTNAFLTDIHHRFKADQGYSQLEISQKRDAIENVLIPETLEKHTERLKQAGFTVVTPWMQNLQFISILAVK
ncbi:carboxy-S-adenosyl-L-methionine synthase CmoA [Arenicella sp. 4NH20-0111]|uniref:carboxy-S-adenosyl-L-methionine synthase CmoA n=1 Tax=Arenicella sp. 4NH20-0111 TaxID=3127648 RepID=UPI00310A5328